MSLENERNATKLSDHRNCMQLSPYPQQYHTYQLLREPFHRNLAHMRGITWSPLPPQQPNPWYSTTGRTVELTAKFSHNWWWVLFPHEFVYFLCAWTDRISPNVQYKVHVLNKLFSNKQIYTYIQHYHFFLIALLPFPRAAHLHSPPLMTPHCPKHQPR